MGNVNTALSDLRKGMELEPYNELEQRRLSDVLFKAERYNEVIEGENCMLDERI
jgi:hypothetical protein